VTVIVAADCADADLYAKNIIAATANIAINIFMLCSAA